MNIDHMIEVLTAAKNGESIEFRHSELTGREWGKVISPIFNFVTYDYRIATKKEMTLVEELRVEGACMDRYQYELLTRAADRIEELENQPQLTFATRTNGELLDELKRRLCK